jgi:hypothetical protein
MNKMILRVIEKDDPGFYIYWLKVNCFDLDLGQSRSHIGIRSGATPLDKCQIDYEMIWYEKKNIEVTVEPA